LAFVFFAAFLGAHVIEAILLDLGDLNEPSHIDKAMAGSGGMKR